MSNSEKLIIVGSGPAGLCAAIYASRGNLAPVLIAGPSVGGILVIATDIDDYPGFPEGVKAFNLARYFLKQAERFGTRIIYEEVISVDFSKKPFEITTKEKTYQTLSVIIASGSSPLWLGVENEKKFIGRGVSVCATCDGPFFKGKKVAVIGGGDSAFKEALYLSKLASEVIIIHRRDTFRAQKILQKLAETKENIKYLFNSEAIKILGEEKVSGLIIKNNLTGKEDKLEVEGIFIAIGYKPATDFLKGQIELDNKGFIVKRGETETSVPGVFVAGDVADPRYRQIATAVGSGAKAALDADKYLDSLNT